MNKKLIHLRFVFFIILITFLSLVTSLPAYTASENETGKSVLNRERAYEKRILWGERFFSLHLNTLALKQFEKAGEIKPGAYFPKYRIKQINLRLNQSQNNFVSEFIFDFNKPGFLITALILVILFSITSMVIALASALINRNNMMRAEKRKQYLREEYQTMLVNYLFSTDISKEFISKIRKISTNKFNRRVLIDQMIDLSITLTGDEKERLKNLYLLLGLDKDSHRKAMSRKWHIKAKGFRELAFMNIPSANDEIKRCLTSRNDILRMEAQFAMIRLYPDNAFEFLNQLHKKYTLWEQLNVYETITFHQLSLPDFDVLLKSSNDSIIMFSLRMIKIFQLRKTFHSMLELLSHKSSEIRNLTIHVMGALKIHDCLPHLKRIYKTETYENCIEIIRAIASINDESMLGFLKLVLDKEDDVQLQIEAAMAINKLGIEGSMTLNKLLTSDYKNYQIIVKHVLDKRIN